MNMSPMKVICSYKSSFDITEKQPILSTPTSSIVYTLQKHWEALYTAS